MTITIILGGVLLVILSARIGKKIERHSYYNYFSTDEMNEMLRKFQEEEEFEEHQESCLKKSGQAATCMCEINKILERTRGK